MGCVYIYMYTYVCIYTGDQFPGSVSSRSWLRLSPEMLVASPGLYFPAQPMLAGRDPAPWGCQGSRPHFHGPADPFWDGRGERKYPGEREKEQGKREGEEEEGNL